MEEKEGAEAGVSSLVLQWILEQRCQGIKRQECSRQFMWTTKSIRMVTVKEGVTNYDLLKVTLNTCQEDPSI